MTQLDLTRREALPVEVTIDGARLCRHHGRRITGPGYPCDLCRAAGGELVEVIKALCGAARTLGLLGEKGGDRG